MTKKKEILHTNMDMEQIPAAKFEDHAIEAEGDDILQTDTEHLNSDIISADGNPEESKEDALSQTDTAEVEIVSPSDSGEDTPDKSPPKVRATRKKKTEIQNESDETAEFTSVDESAPEERPRKRRTVKPIQAVMAIDEERTVETDADKARNDLLDLTESLKSGRILSGTVQGVERTKDDSLAVLYHGSYKVIIPFDEALNPPEDYRGQTPGDMHYYLLNKRLGAEVDYIVKGIDEEAGIAVASRLEAMRAKRKKYYFATDRNGDRILYPGVCAEARVVSVIRPGLFADVFGLEVYIPLRELSYQRMMDATVYFQAGQRILVKLTTLDTSDRNNIQATASIKQATENPYTKAIRRYTVGNRYVGTVSVVDTTGVFVSLDGGIDCLCSYPKRGRPPRGAHVTVRILGIDRETNRIWGAITHTATPR